MACIAPQTGLATLDLRLTAKEADRDSYANLVNRAREIESTYKAWQKSRKELEEWDKVASKFHDHDKELRALTGKNCGGEGETGAGT